MSNPSSKQILTLRQRIILSHVWSLAEEERMLLTFYRKFYSSAKELCIHIKTSHEYKDMLDYKGTDHVIQYVNTCYSELEELTGQTAILISIRQNNSNNFYSALILKNPKPNQLTDETPQYLVDDPNGVQ